MKLKKLLTHFIHIPDNNTVWEFYEIADGYVAKLNDGHITFMNVAKNGYGIIVGNGADDASTTNIESIQIDDIEVFKLVKVD